MMWIILTEISQVKGFKGVVDMIVDNPVITSKTEEGVVAPFPGWSPERQKRVDEFNLQYALKKLQSLMQIWESVRPILNEYYDITVKGATCERYGIKGLPCPQEHPLNEKILEYKARFQSTHNPWDFVFLEDYIEDAVRIANAIKDEEQSKRLKAGIEPAKIAPPREEVMRKPFKWDDGIINPLDGMNWQNIGVATSTAYEYNPTIVEVGSADTLVAAFNVMPCNAWCAVSHTRECAVVARSVNQGNTWNLWFCVHSPSYNVGEVAIGEEDYRKILVLAYTSDYYFPDYDVGAFVFHVSDPFTRSFSVWVDITTVSTITPYVNAEFNWGQSGCYGQWTGSCGCTASDNWWFIGMNKLGTSDADGDGYRDGNGVRIRRSTNCGSSWSISYDGPNRNGSAYDNNQIMLETTNDPRGNSPVCSSSNGGDNTIQAVYNWKNPNSCADPCTDNRIEHLFTDASMSWGGSWTSTTVYTTNRPVNQPWLSVSRSLTATGTRALILYERRWSSTDGDIHGLYATGIPPSGWTWFSLDNSSVDSRTPTVHTEARWQWCPGITSTSANEFHTAFYHRCPNTFDGPLCSEPYTVYNNTYRVAVMKALWTNPTSWGPEYCGTTRADTISTPPPPSFSGGGIWQNWWQINGTTYKITPSAFGEWWFGALWVYRYSSTDWDMYWTVLTCALGGDEELSVEERNKTKEDIRLDGKMLYLPYRAGVYSITGRKVFEGKGWVLLSTGTYFVKDGRGIKRIMVR